MFAANWVEAENGRNRKELSARFETQEEAISFMKDQFNNNKKYCYGDGEVIDIDKKIIVFADEDL